MVLCMEIISHFRIITLSVIRLIKWAPLYIQGCHWSGNNQGNSRSGNFKICQGNLEFC